MAEQAFSLKDVERLLRAILPDGREDPFGELRSELISLREEQVEDDAVHTVRFEEVAERLDSIETRTFGIMILQIIKILRTLMGLLPAGRFILLGIAAMGLLTTFPQSGTVTGDDIRNAVAKSGFSDFIRNQIQKIAAVVDAQATRVEDVLLLGQTVYDSMLVRLGALESDLQFMSGRLTEPGESIDELVADLNDAMLTANDTLLVLGNQLSNTDNLIFGALRAIPEKLRGIPAEVVAMTE